MTNSLADIVVKACPFCGGEASAEGHIRYSRPLPDTWWEDGSEITEAFYVNCIRCGIANGRAGLVGGYQTRVEAIERWNTRTDPLATLVLEAREALFDARSGWRYIRAYHGELSGVGWDRVEDKLSATLAKLESL